MITEIKVPKRLHGKEISIYFHNIRIPDEIIKGKIMVEIYPIEDIIDKEYNGTGLIFYKIEENSEEKTCLGANAVDMNIVEVYEFIKEYFKKYIKN